MKFHHHHHRTSAAALLFVLCLLLTPTAEARAVRDGDWSVPEKIVRIIRTLQHFFGVSTTADYPNPPKP